MTSESKIAANRRNARRSSGPRTAQGKLRVSRNALRHGLAVIAHRAPAVDAELDRLATAIGGEHADAAAREQALIIAESELTLLRVRAVRTNIFEQVLLATDATREPGDQLHTRLRAGVIGGLHVEQLNRLERMTAEHSRGGSMRFDVFWISRIERCLNFKLRCETLRCRLGRTKPNE